MTARSFSTILLCLSLTVMLPGCGPSNNVSDPFGNEGKDENELQTKTKNLLMELFYATDGENWKNNSGWGIEDDLSQWYGVTVNNAGSVTKISLTDNNLSGTLPDIFDKFPDLEVLNLNKNSLQGQIPQSFKDFKKEGFSANLQYNYFELTTFKVPNDRIEPVATAMRVYPQNAPSTFRLFVDSEVDGTGEVHPDNSCELWSTHTEGAGVEIYFIGEGYDRDENTVGGTAEYWLKVGAEAFFDIEPYGRLKKYFDVYLVYNHSPEKGISLYGDMKNTNFKIEKTESGSELLGDSGACFNVIKTALGRLPQQMGAVNIAMNSTHNALGGGVEYRRTHEGINMGYGLCQTRPSAYRGLVKHETGGHAFGGLLDEYTGDREMTNTYLNRITSSANIDTKSDPSTVKWAQYIADKRYKNEDLGVFEGGFAFSKGVFRPSQTSMMYASGSRKNYYNVPSRAEIYRRVMSKAFPDTYEWDYETFVKWDLQIE